MGTSGSHAHTFVGARATPGSRSISISLALGLVEHPRGEGLDFGAVPAAARDDQEVLARHRHSAARPAGKQWHQLALLDETIDMRRAPDGDALALALALDGGADRLVVVIPLGRAASTRIFKPASTDSRFAMLPANEFACARLAQAVGLPVADTGIATFGGVRVLVVARFDRVKQGAGVARLHQIDLCQMINLPRRRKYGSAGGIDTADLFDACGHTSVPALSRRMLLRAWLFNFIIGNADAHAKNHSFVWRAETGHWQVAPLYDLLSVAPYLPAQAQSMGLLDEYRPGWFEAAHWRELARLAGVTPAYLVAEAGRMAAAIRGAVPALAIELRAALTPDELDFLAERVNPVVRERVARLPGTG